MSVGKGADIFKLNKLGVASVQRGPRESPDKNGKEMDVKYGKVEVEERTIVTAEQKRRQKGQHGKK